MHVWGTFFVAYIRNSVALMSDVWVVISENAASSFSQQRIIPLKIHFAPFKNEKKGTILLGFFSASIFGMATHVG